VRSELSNAQLEFILRASASFVGDFLGRLHHGIFGILHLDRAVLGNLIKTQDIDMTRLATLIKFSSRDFQLNFHAKQRLIELIEIITMASEWNSISCRGK
jgi:hypothetical protein